LSWVREGTRDFHPIDVEDPIQVIDLVLEDSGVPAIGGDRHGFPLFSFKATQPETA